MLAPKNGGRRNLSGAIAPHRRPAHRHAPPRTAPAAAPPPLRMYRRTRDPRRGAGRRPQPQPHSDQTVTSEAHRYAQNTEVCVVGGCLRCMRPSCPPVAVRPGRGRGWPPRPPSGERRGGDRGRHARLGLRRYVLPSGLSRPNTVIVYSICLCDVSRQPRRRARGHTHTQKFGGARGSPPGPDFTKKVNKPIRITV